MECVGSAGRHRAPSAPCRPRADLPAERVGYAKRDPAQLVATAAGHGPNIGIYAERLLDDPLPWTRMRAVYRLLGLVRRHGPQPVNTARGSALDLDVVAVGKIDAMLTKELENTTPIMPAAAGHPAGRFTRQPAEFQISRTTLTLVPLIDSSSHNSPEGRS